jgi:hypothetical protein
MKSFSVEKMSEKKNNKSAKIDEPSFLLLSTVAKMDL